MNASLADQFRQQGYLHFRGVIPPEDLAAARAAADGYFARGGSHLYTRDYLRIPALARLPFLPGLVEAIASVFGRDYVTVTQFVATANLHNPQWHRDSQSQSGHAYLYDPEYQVSKCGVYLQDNDPEWGGGMEILPGSHLPGFLGARGPSAGPLGRIVRRAQRWALELRERGLKPLWLPFKAGDALLFHANLQHRASQPHPDKPRAGYKNVALANPPQEKFKYLIDWEVSPNNRYAEVYLRHQLQRGKESGTLFEQTAGTRFPDDYDPQLVEHIRKAGLRVMSYADVAAGEKR